MWDHLDFHIYYQKSFSGRPPLLSSPHPRSENMVKAYFLVKKRQSHPKVTLSQKHVVSSNQKEDNPLSLTKILRNYTSTIPYFLIMSTPLQDKFSVLLQNAFRMRFYGAKNKVCNDCTLYFLRVALKTHFRGYFLPCQSAYSAAFLPVMSLN